MGSNRKRSISSSQKAGQSSVQILFSKFVLPLENCLLVIVATRKIKKKNKTKQVQRRARGIMLSSVGLVTFNWDTKRIAYDSVKAHLDELEYVRNLQTETIICSVCNKRIQIDCKVDGIDYCMCPKDVTNKRKAVYSDPTNKKRRWQPYIERKNMIVWRREEQNGLYAYKGM